MTYENEPLHYLDVGAANDTRELEWSYRCWPLHVTMVEPHPESASKLLQQGSRDYEMQDVLECALGAGNGIANLNLCRKVEVSSQFEPNLNLLTRYPNPERFSVIDSTEVQASRLDDVELKLGPIDFMRLDTQGSEYDILLGATQSLVPCVALQIEVEFLELYIGQMLFGDVHRLLIDQGFEFWDFTTIYRYGRYRLDRTGQAVFADALFLKPPEYFAAKADTGSRRSLEMLRRVATVFGKTDIAMRCVDLLE